MQNVTWKKINYEEGTGFPPGSFNSDDEMILITDGICVGIADWCGDCFERIDWCFPPWPEDLVKKYRERENYIDDLSGRFPRITHWMPLPELPKDQEEKSEDCVNGKM